MSGIAGFVDTRLNLSEAALTGAIDRMTIQLLHRGPDDGGSVVDAPMGLALGCRRLAIQDRTKNGRQPMESANRRYLIVFDGAIYNFQELKKELLATGMRGWRGSSDTEVLLAAMSRIGVAGTLDRCDGMYAFALLDRQAKRLHLVRDRLGEKPLYFGWGGTSLLFASELKALAAHPSWQGAIDRQAAAAYMQFGYVPAPLTIYHGIRKLPPAHWITLDLDGLKPGVMPVPRPYWNQRVLIEHAVDAPYDGDIEAAVGRLDQILGRSVERRLSADVSVGVHLSGSVASHAIAAMASETATEPIRTFSIAYDDRERRTADQASAAARWLGSEHTALEAPKGAPMRTIERLPQVFDEPYAGRTQLQSVFLAEALREHTAAVISDVGGEALFGGGPRRRAAQNHWQHIRHKTTRRSLAAFALRWCPFRALNRFSSAGDWLFEKLSKTAGPTPEFLLARYRTFWQGVDNPMHRFDFMPYDDGTVWTPATPSAARLLNADVSTTLPNDSLVALDRASMAVGVQLRAPMLSRELVEFVLSLPTMENGGKGMAERALVQLAEHHAGGDLDITGAVDSGPPLAAWLRGPLADWAGDLLSPETLKQDDLLRAEPVLAAWRQHRDGMADRSGDIWTVLMFQAWRAEWL